MVQAARGLYNETGKQPVYKPDIEDWISDLLHHAAFENVCFLKNQDQHGKTS